MLPDADKTTQPALPLDDVTIVDFTSNGAGPACTMLFGDFGADIIKVESTTGDNTRHWGSTRLGQRGDLTPAFISLNRNKSSIALDLKSAEGKEEALGLIGEADVVIESFTPGVMSRLGLDMTTSAVQIRFIAVCRGSARPGRSPTGQVLTC